MATIVTRAGKGSPLTHEEVDANFTNLNDEAATKAPLASPVFTGNVGIGTSSTPTVKTEISGNTPAACLFVGTVSGTTLTVASVSSGALAVGQYLLNTNQRIRITALGTGTGGVGTYTLDSDQTGSSFIASYVLEPITLRLGNSATTYARGMPFGAIEFGGAVTNVGPRGFVQVGAGTSASSAATASMLFGVGLGNGASPPRTTMFLNPNNASLPGNLLLGQANLSPRNLTIAPPNINFGGRSQTIYSSGTSLSNLSFSTAYIDGGVETFATYGQLGYTVDSSITSGQLPSNFYIQTRNASGTTAERFRITKDGNVGIGTTAPAAKLEVVGTAQVTSTLVVGGQLVSSSSGSAAAPGLANSTGVSGIFFPTTDTIAFSQASTERMRITSAGNVGIGTSTPAATLDVAGTGAIKVPVGTDAERPTSATGLLRFNTDAASFEGYNGTEWGSIGGGATSDAVYENSATIAENITLATGRNGMSTGPITIDDGVTVTVSSGARYVVI